MSISLSLESVTYISF